MTAAVFSSGVSKGFNIAIAAYEGKSKNLSALASESNALQAVVFKSDGTKCYALYGDSSRIYQFSLSTAWDISTAIYDSVSLNISAQTGVDASSMFIGNSGSTLFVSAATTIYQYTMSSAWNLATASYDSKSFTDASSGSDGVYLTATKLFMCNASSNVIRQYSVGTPWDISTASYDSVSLSITDASSDNQCFTFVNQGNSIIIAGRTNTRVYQYNVTTPYTLSGGALWPSSLNVSAQVGGSNQLRNIAATDAGRKVYVQNSSTVYQYRF